MFTVEKKLIISWTPLLLWMVLIFAFSSQPSKETNHLSVGVSQIILQSKAASSLGVDESENTIKMFNFVIRHFAHFFLFFVLGLLVINALWAVKNKMKHALWLSVAICFLYAVSDETHQLFVPGRFSSIRDVAIDTAGAILGIAIYWLIEKNMSKNYHG